MADKIKLRINVPLRGFQAGTVLEVDAKADGSPAELFWRRRLRDASRAQGGDGCVEVVPPAGVESRASATVPVERTAEPIEAAEPARGKK